MFNTPASSQELSPAKQLGLLIKAARELKGLSQKELAEKINYTDRQLRRWESGATATMPWFAMVAIAAATEQPLDSFQIKPTIKRKVTEH